MNAEYFLTGYVDEADAPEPEEPEDTRDYDMANAALAAARPSPAEEDEYEIVRRQPRLPRRKDSAA